MNSGVPPNNIALGGERALYAWGHHLVVAGFVQAFNLPPSIVFATSNVIALLFALMVAYYIAKLFVPGQMAGVFSAMLGLYGCSYLTRGPFVDLSRYVLGMVGYTYRVEEYRALQVAKFYNLNSNGIGILFFALCLYLTLRILAKPTALKTHFIGLCSSVVGLIFFYPYYLLDLLAVTFVMGLVTYGLMRRRSLKKLSQIGAAMVVGIAIVSPYIYLVGSGKSESLHAFTHNLGWVVGKTIITVLAIAPVALLLLLRRQTMVPLIREKTLLFACLGSAIAVLAAMHILLEEPLGVEYKHLILCLFCVGILGGLALQDIYLKSHLASFLLVVLFMVPFSYDWLGIADVDRWPHSDPLVEEGRYLVHQDPDEQSLHQWILANTSNDALFVDTHLNIPVFARRQLYVGSTLRQAELRSADPPIDDGWRLTPQQFLESQGYAQDLIERRLSTVDKIYDESSRIDQTIVSELQLAKGRPIFVIAREANSDRKLADSPDFAQVFRQADLTLYELRSDTP
ncbi:MAG TPA: hypothetical protein VEZ50_14045 [Nodosilinea sp.]|nr:hypothetical protein [Nodosilinea sp.]